VLLVVNLAWIAGPGHDTGIIKHWLGPSTAAEHPAAGEQRLLSRAEAMFDRARAGFVLSGGDTNLGGDISVDSIKGRLRALGFGALLLFVPISVLGWLGVVSLPGGSALLLVADLDTVFIDFSVVALLVAMAGAGRRHLNVPYAGFIALVVLSTGLALGYVVTNFGTLFRLRLMIVVPLWMLALAISYRLPETRSSRQPERAGSISLSDP